MAGSLPLGLPAAASAASCHSSKKECAYGDTVTESLTLSQDVESCGHVGLQLRSDVTLDCTGHVILGRSSREGILLQGIERIHLYHNTLNDNGRRNLDVRAPRTRLLAMSTKNERSVK